MLRTFCGRHPFGVCIDVPDFLVELHSLRSESRCLHPRSRHLLFLDLLLGGLRLPLGRQPRGIVRAGGRSWARDRIDRFFAVARGALLASVFSDLAVVPDAPNQTCFVYAPCLLAAEAEAVLHAVRE